MHYVMHKAITFGTCTCSAVPPLLLDPSPGDSLPDTTMLLKSCNDGMMRHSRKVLVGDSFFGSHDAAAMLCATGRPYLMLTATNPLVQDGNVGLNAGCVNTVVHEKHKYALSVHKNPEAQSGKSGTTSDQLFARTTMHSRVYQFWHHCELS